MALSATEFTPLWDEFRRRLSEGASVRKLAAEYNVNLGTIWTVSESTPERATQYARARDAQAHALAQEAIDLADACVGQSSDVVQATRLQVDTRKWYTSKIAPRFYGEKLDVTSAGAALKIVVERTQERDPSAVPPV